MLLLHYFSVLQHLIFCMAIVSVGLWISLSLYSNVNDCKFKGLSLFNGSKYNPENLCAMKSYGHTQKKMIPLYDLEN